MLALLTIGSAAAVSVVVDPSHLVLTTPAATAQVTVVAPGVAAPRLWASTGELTAPVAIAPGRFQATYRAPMSGPPAYAVVAAWDPAGGRPAAVTVALEGRIEVPVETEPGAQVLAVAGGRRAIAHADASGRASVVLQVPPGVHGARVTATDRAGNSTVEEVGLGVPPSATVWIVEPEAVAAGELARVYAFAAEGQRPKLSAGGTRLEVDAGPGVAVARLRPTRDLTVTASNGSGRVSAQVHVRGGPSPEAGAPSQRPPLLVEPRWELGVSGGPRYSGAFVGGALTIEGRHRLRRLPLHLGLDVEGLAVAGNVGARDLIVGGVGVRGLIELRWSVLDRLAVFVAAELGAYLAREQITPSVGKTDDAWDGAPSLGARIGLLAQLGPGLVTVQLGYAWTPLVGQDLAGLDGAMLAVGYRGARW